MPVQSRDILSHELHQGRPSCSVKSRAKSPRTFLVSTKDKAIRFQRKDELLELFPGSYIGRRNKERRVLPFAFDHPSGTVGADVRPPLQRNLILRDLPLGIGVDPPPLKWSDLRYVFDIQEDCNGKEAIQA